MNDLPGFTKKRKILYSPKVSKEELVKMGRAFLDADFCDDAIEFFTRAEAEDMIQEVARRAYKAADTPLYLRAKRALKEDITREEFEHLARANMESGKLSMAYLAYSKAGMEEKAEEVRAMQQGDVPGTETQSD